MIVELPGFLGVVAMMTIVPGPDTALVVRNAVRGGRRAGFATAVGCALGLMIWAFITVLGLLTVRRLSDALFEGIQLIGAAYLLVLGTRCVISASSKARARDEGCPESRPAATTNSCTCRPRRSLLGASLEGCVADLLNPKAAVFFTALFPQFLGSGESVFAALGLGLIAAFGALVGLAAYAFAAGVVGETFRRGWPAVALDVVTGVVLFLFGVTLVRRSAILARGSALHGT